MMRLADACARGARGVRDAASSMLGGAPRGRSRRDKDLPTMPVLEKGCYCCDLLACVKAQGYAFAAVSLVLAALDLVLLAVLVGPREQNPGPYVDEFGRRFISNTKVACMAAFVGLILWACVCVLMLYGVYKRRRMLFWPYMAGAAGIALATLGLLVFYASSLQALLSVTLLLLAVLAAQLYFLLCVVSLFQRMGIEERAELAEAADADADADPAPLQ